MTLAEQASVAAGGARGSAVILSANPMHDTGGGQRSAQLALELLERDFAVLFVSHGKVTETIDLGIRYENPRLISAPLGALSHRHGLAALDALLSLDEAIVLTQVPVRAWEPILARAEAAGAVTVYDCIDRWDSELGRGWYRRSAEERIARGSDILAASAPELVQHVELLAERQAHLVPNAYNSRIFRTDARPERPADLPEGGKVALYVGALWGGWLDWQLMGELARALPETAFVFVGDHRGEGRALPENCAFLGLKPQTALPGYLAHADLAFLPWRTNDVTQATSPLKVYEFVAMGLPVVAPVIETLRGIPGVVQPEDAAGFVEAIRNTGRAGLAPEIREDMAAFSTQNSWVQRVETLLDLGRRRGSGGAKTRAPSAPALSVQAILSVVIPAYNHERYVGQAVDSVRAQSLPAGELVVVDDGSSDGTPDVLADHRFPGMRCVRQNNRGAHEAINRGIALSRGGYIAILNSDDLFAPERLEHAWGVARSTGAALLVGSVRLIDEAGAALADDHDSARWYREARAEPARARSLRGALLRHNFAVTTSNFFFHRELWRRLGGFAAYRYVHDFDFILRALELCPDQVRYEEALDDVLYRVHGHNTILEDVDRALDERAAMLRRLRGPGRRLKALAARPKSRRAVQRAVDESDGLAPVVVGATPSAPPIRLGLVVRSLDHGGLEEVVALLAQTLPAHGISVELLCTHAGGAVADRLAAAGVPVTVAKGRRPEWRRWGESAAVQLVSTHFADAEVVEELAELGVPIFETVHNTYAWFSRDDWARETRKRTRLTGTIAVSDVVARYYARHTGTPVSPHVIPNGVHPARVAAVPRAWARHRFGLTPDAPVFVHVGRVTLQKNLSGLLEAFSAVVEREPGARLLLAGAVDDRPYVRALRRAHRTLLGRGAARLLPPQAHVGGLLSAADAYVSNSFFEGWSLAASEACWSGLPLVLSDCGGSRELVGADGSRGLVVPNPLGDPLEVTWARLTEPPPDTLEENRRAMVEAMVDIIGSRRSWAERREDMRAQARGELGPSRVSRAYGDLFRGAVGT